MSVNLKTFYNPYLQDNPDPANLLAIDSVGWVDGTHVDTGEVPDAPSTPTLSVAIDGTTATVTITGDAGVTHYLLHKKITETDWQVGAVGVGDGDVEITDLDAGATYVFTVYSYNGVISVPASEVAYVPAEQTETDPSPISDQQTAAMVQLIDLRGVMVTYRPAGGIARSIKAVIIQKQPAQLGSMPKASSTFTTALVLNDSTTGISSAEIDRGGDKIDVETRIGKAATTRRVKDIIFHNASVMKLEIR